MYIGRIDDADSKRLGVGFSYSVQLACCVSTAVRWITSVPARTIESSSSLNGDEQGRNHLRVDGKLVDFVDVPCRRNPDL